MDSTSRIQFVATARDLASAQIKTLNRNIQQLGVSSKAVGGAGTGPLGGMIGGMAKMTVTAFAAGAAIGLIGEGIRGALEEEKQFARLDQALQNNVRNWDGTREAIDRAAESAMDFAFSDDAARESLIKLLPATKNEAEAVRLLNLAMNVARGRNIDLAAATDIVIKAHMGNVGALRRVGIAIDKNATSTEIVAHLTRIYAGNADAYAKTTAGKFEAAQMKVDNAMEDVGHELITVTAGFLSHSDAVKGDTEAAVDFLDAGGTLIPFFRDLSAAVDDATTTTLEFGAEVRRLPKVVAENIESGIPVVRRAVGDLLHEAFLTDRRAEFEAAARQFGNLFTDDLAGSLRNNKDVVETAMDTVMWAIKHPMQLQKELARIEGALTTMEYQLGLAEGNPGVQMVITQQMNGLKAQWTALTGVAYQKGVDAATAYENGLGTFTSPKFPLGMKGPSRLKGQDYTGYADGGHMAPGEIGIVGERGPELIHAGPQGATITPNHALGVAPHTHPIIIDGRRVFDAVDERMGRRLSRTPAGVVNRG